MKIRISMSSCEDCVPQDNTSSGCGTCGAWLSNEVIAEISAKLDSVRIEYEWIPRAL